MNLAIAANTAHKRAAGAHFLSKRLAHATLAISLAISTLVIALQLLNSYRIAVGNADTRLDEIGKSIVPSLSASLWQVDTEHAYMLLDGVARLPEVAYVKLDSHEGDRYEQGEARATALAARDYAL